LLRTFLIADIRGYTTFTREHGDEIAARLAKKFADLARDAVESRGGEVIELRGDEALAIFASTEQAVRAALEFQETTREETAEDPELPLPVGIGIDAGEAVPVEDGFRGRALNMAARLCAKASAGQVLLTRDAAALCVDLDGFRFEERGSVDLKGFDAPVDLLEALAPSRPAPQAADDAAAEPVPVDLEDSTPMVGREHELRWLRGTWRRARRGDGALVFVSGAAGIGKTRLLAEVGSVVQASGGRVRYAGAGGEGAARALSAIREAGSARNPALIVVDDLDALGDPVVDGLRDAADAIAGRPVLVVAAMRNVERDRGLAELVRAIDVRGDAHRSLRPLAAAGVAEIARFYSGPEVEDAPVESLLRASGGIPARVHEVVGDWARDEANRRLAAAAEWLATGRDRQAAELEFANNVISRRIGRLYAVEGGHAASDVCPYKGLASFGRDDAAYFFGRERLVGELAARTVGTGLLGVVGPSGSGKSSVVLAGLLPSLAAGLLPGSERWTLVVIRPGEHPARTLSAALEDSHSRLVVAVDQFEEVFTTASIEEREEFADALVRLAADPDAAVVVLTIREDYYGRCAAYPDLDALLAANHVLVGPMSPEELHRAIEMPARRAGLRVESSLSDSLVEEVADEPGGLPLLSTTLVELWLHRDDGWLRTEAYRRTGGVRGAVARLAETAFDQLEGSEREAARAILLRLVGQGEGDAAVRRRVPVSEFDRTPAAEAVLARFTEDRLLTASDGMVEVAHEALIREWPRLRGWLEEDVQGQQIRRHITQTAKTWDERGRDDAELYRGARLSATIDWAAGHGRELNELEREFLSESRLAGEREAERQRRTNRRLRGLLVGTAVFLVVALLAGALALVQRGHARRSATEAEHGARVALAKSLGAQAVIDPQLDQAMLLAREGVNLWPDEATRNFLLTTLERSPQAIGVLHSPEGARPFDIALSPDERTLAIGENNGDVVFRDTRTGAEAGGAMKGAGPFVAYTPDGSKIVTVPPTHGLIKALDIYDAASHSLMSSVAVPESMTRTAYSIALSFSPDGRTLLAGSDSSPPGNGGPPRSIGYLMRVDLSTGAASGPVLTVPGGIAAASFSPDGRRIITAGQQTHVFDARSGRVVSRRDFGNPAGPSAAISPDGRYVAAQNGAGDLDLLDLETGGVATLSSGTGAIVRLLFTPDSKTLVTSGENHLVQVWDDSAHSLRETLTGHGGPVHQLAISRDGSTLYSGSLDGTIFEWDLSGTRSFGRSVRVSSGDDGNFGLDPNVAISPDGTTLATGETDGTVVLADASTLRRIGSFHPMELQIASVSFGPEGHTLAVAGGLYEPDNSIRGLMEIWKLGSHPSLLRTLHGMDFEAWATYTPDGKSIVAGGGMNVVNNTGPGGVAAVAEWDAASGKLVAAPTRVPSPAALQVASNADGTRIAAALANADAVIVDPIHRKILRTIEVGGGTVAAIAVSRDGRTMAAGADTGFAGLWDVATGRAIGTRFKASDGLVTGMQFSADGRILLTTASDGSTRLFDVGTQREIGNPFPGQDQTWGYGVFTPDQSNVVVVFSDGVADVWPASLRSWEDLACAVAGRNFTAAEWTQFVGPGYPHPNLCH